MKSLINIIVETNNVIPVYDDNNNLIVEVSKQLEEEFHKVVKQWIIDNLQEEILTNIIQDTSASNIFDSITQLDNLSDIKIIVKTDKETETVVDVLRFIPPEEQIISEKKVIINLEDDVEIPPMQTQDDDDIDEYIEKMHQIEQRAKTTQLDDDNDENIEDINNEQDNDEQKDVDEDL